MSYRGYSSFKLTPIWAIIGINTFLLIITFVLPRLIFLLGLTPIVFLQEPWTIWLMATNCGLPSRDRTEPSMEYRLG